MGVGKDKKPGENPGEGLRSLKTSGVFRTLNFELYTRPNKYMMWFGALTFGSCLGYLAYLKYIWRNQKVYTAMSDDDELVLRKKVSRWE